MKRNPSGVNLLRQQQNNRRTPLWSTFPDVFIQKEEHEIITGGLEGKEPPDGDFLIHRYTDKYHFISSKYTINKYGEIKSLKGDIMKYLFYPNKRGPRVRLQITIRKDGRDINIEREFSVYKLMERNFRYYIKGYTQKKNNPKQYILVPKDGNENNMRYDNLEYIDKRNGTKRKYIENLLLSNNDVSVESICRLLKTTPKYVKKILAELAKKRDSEDRPNQDNKKGYSKENEGILESFISYEKLQDKLGIQFTRENFEIYKILIDSKGELSNMEIARKLRPQEIVDIKKRRNLNKKIVHVRKNLTEKGLIPRFNELFESKRELAVTMILDKPRSGMTNKEIAECLGLKKDQIDNLSKQIRKKASLKKEK